MATRRATGTGGKIRKRKDGRYEAQVSLGGAPRARASTSRYTAARSARSGPSAQVLRVTAASAYRAPERLTV